MPPRPARNQNRSTNTPRPNSSSPHPLPPPNTPQTRTGQNPTDIPFPAYAARTSIPPSFIDTPKAEKDLFDITDPTWRKHFPHSSARVKTDANGNSIYEVRFQLSGAQVPATCTLKSGQIKKNGPKSWVILFYGPWIHPVTRKLEIGLVALDVVTVPENYCYDIKPKMSYNRNESCWIVSWDKKEGELKSWEKRMEDLRREMREDNQIHPGDELHQILLRVELEFYEDLTRQRRSAG